MNPDDLLRLVKRFYVYTPYNIPIRTEMKNLIDHLESQKQKYPHIEILEKEEVEEIKTIEQEDNKDEA